MLKLFRVVSDAELADLQSVGHFRASAGGFEECKWFATSVDHAFAWGRLFERLDGVPHRSVVSIEIDLKSPVRFTRCPMLDGIGPAYCIDVEDLRRVQWSVVF